MHPLSPLADLVEIISSVSPGDRLIAVEVGPEVVTVLRGDFRLLVVPRDWFKPAGGVEPDFTDPQITDWGFTLRLGPYEAASDALLFEFDPEYRLAAQARAELRTTEAGR